MSGNRRTKNRLIMSQSASLGRRILAHPFRYYTRAMGTTFCLTGTINGLSMTLTPDRREFMAQHPEMIATALLTKSAYYGALWPAFYLLLATHPTNACVLFSGFTE